RLVRAQCLDLGGDLGGDGKRACLRGEIVESLPVREPLGDEALALAPRRSPSGELLAGVVDRHELLVAAEAGELAEERRIRRRGERRFAPGALPQVLHPFEEAAGRVGFLVRRGLNSRLLEDLAQREALLDGDRGAFEAEIGDAEVLLVELL